MDQRFLFPLPLHFIDPDTARGAMTFFHFEDDFVQSLKCIPMQVRFKLDTCGVKLKLAHWHQFSTQERERLVDMPCTTIDDIQTYKTHLQSLVTQYTGKPASELSIDPSPAWLDVTTIPTTTQDKAASLDLHISVEQWRDLSPLQRFALIKLSRPSHENRNFLPAVKEFNLG